jgi:general secretion pathway protein L
MSTLVVQIPSRERLRARSPGTAEPLAADAGHEYAYVLSPDGLTVQAQGRCAPALLPKADQLVAVLADADVSWHRIPLPKAPTARLREALVGVLEEALLADTEAVHLAVAPQASAGQLTWIAAVDKAWLRAELARLEKADLSVDRVVPSSWPDDPPSGHFAELPGDATGQGPGIGLQWSHADGVASLRLHGSLARALLPESARAGCRWSATPGAAAAAEHWLGMPVNVMPPAERALQAARSLWNLRQFDLAQRTRGSRALRDWRRQFMSAAWRPVRFGLVALLAAQVVGLNLWAWHQRDAIEARQAAIRDLVKATFPRVNPVDVQRDALAVMQREAQTLRAIAGKAGDGDLDTLLLVAASAWPAGRGPAEALRFEAGRLTLSTSGWTEQQVEQFRGQLRPAGWLVESEAGRLTLSRSRGAGARA